MQGGIIETRYDPNQPRNEKGEWTSTGASDTFPCVLKLDDIQIHRSVGAKAKNYDVMDLATGERYHFAEGTKLQNVEVFAGKGTKTPFRKADAYAERYGGEAKNWQHVKGFGTLDTPDGDRDAEVHWVQCQGVGKHEFFIKEWLE